VAIPFQEIAEGTMARKRRLSETVGLDLKIAGEYTSSRADESELTEAARQEFRRSIHNVYPAFLDSLDREIFPMFWTVATDSRDPADAAFVLTDIESRELILPITIGLGHPRFKAIRSPILAWAKRFNVETEEWFLKDLLRTMYYWAKYPRFRQNRHFDSGISGAQVPFSGAEVEFIFQDPGWVPTKEKWRDFSTRLSESFQNELEAYEARIRSLVESRGYTRVARKDTVEHFDWLVLWQIAGHSQKRIADWHSEQSGKAFDDTRIRQGIEEAARLIGMKRLRPGARGPGRKPKTPA
jgi:hypothetical protein